MNNNGNRNWCSFKPVQSYRNYEIDEFGDGYSVLFCGDEVIFDTLNEAKEFIDYISSK